MRVRCGLGGILFIATVCSANAAPANQSSATHTALDVHASGLKTFYVDNRAGGNQVTFMSEAPIEDFTGVCNQVSGQCKLNPKDIETLTGHFAIKVADMRTGVDLRDTHMRSAEWLDVKQYPQIVIDITGVKGVEKKSKNIATLTLIGTCALHGKTNPVQIPATLTYLDESPKTMARVKGDLMRLRAKFTVKLSDYNITGPEASKTVGLKVADEINIHAAVYGSTTPPPKPLAADNPVHVASDNRPAPPKR